MGGGGGGGIIAGQYGITKLRIHLRKSKNAAEQSELDEIHTLMI